MSDDIARLLGNPRYSQGAKHVDEGTLDPNAASSNERGGADAIAEAVRIGIQGTRSTERQLPPEVGPHAGKSSPQPLQESVSFAAASTPGLSYDDGNVIQEGDIVADGNECLAEVKSITEDGKFIINVPSLGLREVTSMQGCTLKGRRK